MSRRPRRRRSYRTQLIWVTGLVGGYVLVLVACAAWATAWTPFSFTQMVGLFVLCSLLFAVDVVTSGEPR